MAISPDAAMAAAILAQLSGTPDAARRAFAGSTSRPIPRSGRAGVDIANRIGRSPGSALAPIVGQRTSPLGPIPPATALNGAERPMGLGTIRSSTPAASAVPVHSAVPYRGAIDTTASMAGRQAAGAGPGALATLTNDIGPRALPTGQVPSVATYARGAASAAPTAQTATGVATMAEQLALPAGRSGGALVSIADDAAIAGAQAAGTRGASARGAGAVAGLADDAAAAGAGLIDDAAAAVGGAGGGGRSTGWIANLFNGGGGGANAGFLKGLAGKVGPGTIGRSTAYGIGGTIAGNVVNGVIGERDDNWDEAAQGALTGAGYGAAIGTGILPGLGTAIGAGLFGLGGGLIGMFGPKNTGEKAVASELDEMSAKLNEQFDQLDVPQSVRQDLYEQINMTVAMDANSKDDVRTIFRKATAALPQLLDQYELDQEAEVEDNRRRAQAAAIQAAILPLMQKQATRGTDRANAAAGYVSAAAGYQPNQQVAELMRAQAAQIQANAANYNQAAMGQMAAAGQMYDLLGVWPQYTEAAGVPQVDQSGVMAELQQQLAASQMAATGM